ncbi:hypothetical protein IC614_00965 [Allosphingosinicella flava]|uniref:Uncharacterized protein n=1 Tax=Allosphingosinicella flava TaxID=2771430 RepID=A0A7T2LML4_9SPHN|nr:hypothetical protein [Sphingosinicella flava]QPQ55222.1 hypothetical protein IC614_00965 [Sphingosinicella flava]
MKTMLFTAALLIGGAALAQDTKTSEIKSETEAEVQTTAETPPATTDTTTRMTTREGITAEGTDPSGVAVAPPGTNMVATPAGGGVVVDPNQSAAFTTRAATKDYPRCSRTVTDNCVQGRPRR